MRKLPFFILLAPLLAACGLGRSESLIDSSDAGQDSGPIATCPCLDVEDAGQIGTGPASDSGPIFATDAVAPSPFGDGTVFAPAQNAATGIALDDINVYWSTWGTWPDFMDGAILSAPLGGGAPTTLASGQGQPSMVALHAGRVFWTTMLGGTVMSVPVNGGTPTTLASGQNYPYGVAVDDANVYWTSNADGSAVMSVPLAGGTPTTVASGQDRPWGLAIDATTIYWSDNNQAGAVYSAPIAGGPPTVLFQNGDEVGAIAIDATSIYWLTRFALMKAPLGGVPDGGAPTTLANVSVLSVDGMANLAVDAKYVYWTDGLGTVSIVPVGGGSTEVLALSQSQPTGIAVNAAGIYWANAGTYDDDGTGSVMRIAAK